MMTVRAQCLCGELRLIVQGEPDRVGICHCMDCRRHNGAPFNATAIYPASAVEIIGEARDYGGRCFCPTCGSSTYSHSENEIEISLGAFDEPGTFTPSYELWTIRREPWLPDLPTREHHEGDRTPARRAGR